MGCVSRGKLLFFFQCLSKADQGFRSIPKPNRGEKSSFHCTMTYLSLLMEPEQQDRAHSELTNNTKVVQHPLYMHHHPAIFPLPIPLLKEVKCRNKKMLTQMRMLFLRYVAWSFGCVLHILDRPQQIRL